MRALAQPGVLFGAGAAALLTSLACWPRLAGWPGRTEPLVFLWLILLWSSFVLWSFVLGWHRRCTGQSPLTPARSPPRLWLLAGFYGIALACILRFFIDPDLRALKPAEYPGSWPAWLALTGFALAFEPLFLCFAPFAFFIRLARRPQIAAVFTVLFGVLVLYLRLGASPRLPTWSLLVELLVLRVAGGLFGVYFYLQGGVWLSWWVVLLLQLCHLPDLLKLR